MFEKEAENYMQEVIAKKDYPHSISVDWQRGAEFGYNKANEWHKPSEKLPEECSLVLAYSLDDTEPSLWKFVTSGQWEWLPKRIVFCSNDQIRLWKEIVLPKESE